MENNLAQHAPPDGLYVDELRDLLQARSITFGQFTLASGDVSTYYCDTKATILSPQGSFLVGEVLFSYLKQLGCDAVGGLTLGGPLIATAITSSSYQHNSPIYAFAVRDKQKTHGLMHTIEESYHADGEPLIRAGRKACVVDDVVTKGGSVLKAVEAVVDRGADVVGIVALVDRGAGGEEAIRQRGLDYVYVYRTDTHGYLHVNAEFLRRSRSLGEKPTARSVRR